MRAVNREHVDLRLRHFLRSFQKVSRRANRRAHAQAAFVVFGRAWVFQFLLDVLDRDQALQVVFIVHYQQFFHAMLVQNFFRLFERRPHRYGDQVFLGHHLADGDIKAGFKAQIAIGQNADQLAIFQRDRHAGNLVLLHDLQRIRNLGVGRHGHGIDNHAALRPLHFVDFVRLLLDRQIAVNNPDPALLRHGNRHVRLGHRIHSRADNGNVQRNVARNLGLRVGRGRHNFRMRRQQ